MNYQNSSTSLKSRGEEKYPHYIQQQARGTFFPSQDRVAENKGNLYSQFEPEEDNLAQIGLLCLLPLAPIPPRVGCRSLFPQGGRAALAERDPPLILVLRTYTARLLRSILRQSL